jgi:hypothetical protein
VWLVVNGAEDMKPKRQAKFVQLVTWDGDSRRVPTLFALDTDGHVWMLTSASRAVPVAEKPGWTTSVARDVWARISSERCATSKSSGG